MGVPDPHRDPQFYQGVPLRRLVAFFVDIAIVLFLLLCLVFVGGALSLGAIFFAGPLVMVMFSMTGFVYRWILLSQRSATVGMMLTGIEVRDGRGDEMNTATGFIHCRVLCVVLLFAAAVHRVVSDVQLAPSSRNARSDSGIGRDQQTFLT